MRICENLASLSASNPVGDIALARMEEALNECSRGLLFHRCSMRAAGKQHVDGEIGAGHQTRQVTIDDIDNFRAVRNLNPSENLPPWLSESAFKKGVQRILGQGGEFKDWGGERNDLFTTRPRLNGHRIAAAFAFKRPGTKGVLVPGKLGRNGDQIQRLFETDADLFFVQYWREISDSVLVQMRAFAQAKSVPTGRRIYYGVIDGQDSYRLVRAYKKQFPNGKTKNTAKA